MPPAPSTRLETMVAAGATPVVPAPSSRAATTLATSVPWALVGAAVEGRQPVLSQRQRSATCPARSATPVATPVSTTATVRPAPRCPWVCAWTTSAPGRGR